ncbi:MAG: hypothetical protein WCO55_02640 [Candidatus Falkowbacteria bacterium]
MGRKFITLILLAIIVYVGLTFMTARKKSSFIANVCAYTNPTMVSSTIGSLGCRTKILTAMSFGVYKCSEIPKPKCDIRENDILLCKQQIANNTFVGTEEECQSNWACPDATDDYKKLTADCLIK